jgi:3-deoxy-D-manno-octulosonic acid kinase
MKKSQIHSFPAFEVVDHPGARVLSRREAVPWVRYVLEGGNTLYEAAAGDREVFDLPGREPVYSIPAKGDQEEGVGKRWAVRHFSRGGRVLPSLLDDRFLRLGTPRPFHELRVSEGIRSRGIPTPRILAAALYPTSFFYRADLVTEFVPHSTDLVDALFDTRRKGAGGASERLEALRVAGALLRAMGKAGLRHNDLNAGNILLQWEGTTPRSHILDLDRARLLPEGSEAPVGPMLYRLKRSLRKWEGRAGLRLTEREWSTLDAATMG